MSRRPHFWLYLSALVAFVAAFVVWYVSEPVGNLLFVVFGLLLVAASISFMRHGRRERQAIAARYRRGR